MDVGAGGVKGYMGAFRRRFVGEMRECLIALVEGK